MSPHGDVLHLRDIPKGQVTIRAPTYFAHFQCDIHCTSTTLRPHNLDGGLKALLFGADCRQAFQLNVFLNVRGIESEDCKKEIFKCSTTNSTPSSIFG